VSNDSKEVSQLSMSNELKNVSLKLRAEGQQVN